MQSGGHNESHDHIHKSETFDLCKHLGNLTGEAPDVSVDATGRKPDVQNRRDKEVDHKAVEMTAFGYFAQNMVGEVGVKSALFHSLNYGQQVRDLV